MKLLTPPPPQRKGERQCTLCRGVDKKILSRDIKIVDWYDSDLVPIQILLVHNSGAKFAHNTIAVQNVCGIGHKLAPQL
jgi:hypothetical protein